MIIDPYDNYKILCDANNLTDKFFVASKQSKWKDANQIFRINLLPNIYDLLEELVSYSYIPYKPFEFIMNERGKTRYIRANSTRDRIVGHVLCDMILIPILDPYLIYDNGASRKGKGISFSRERLEYHLHNYFLENGTNEGYILIMDFSKYYDNIDHGILMDRFSRYIYDIHTLDLIQTILNNYRIDVSFMDDNELTEYLLEPFNMLDYSKIITPDKTILTGEKFLNRSISIGDQLSQVAAIFYPSEIDTFCKCHLGLKYYARYMDDAYIIHKDKSYLEYIRDLLIDKYQSDLKINININKTHIERIDHTFVYLKIRYYLTESGRVSTRIFIPNVTRMRHKLIKLHNMELAGKIQYIDIQNMFKGWIGGYKKYMPQKTFNNICNLYNELFIDEFINLK